jgi:hypothetical protein
MASPALLCTCLTLSLAFGCSAPVVQAEVGEAVASAQATLPPPPPPPPPLVLPPPIVPDPDEDEDEPTFLATLTITGGVRVDGEGPEPCRALTFQAKDRAVLFTERPTRQAASVPIADYVAAWSEAYESSPPNAHIQLFSSAGASFGTVVKLDGAPTWDAATSTVTFPRTCLIAVADGEPLPEDPSFEVGALFIDGAKTFDWNSCYSKEADSNINTYAGCLEQWGSYAASCGKISRRDNARGKRCRKVCGKGVCSSDQCFRKYNSGVSTDLMASFYECD